MTRSIPLLLTLTVLTAYARADDADALRARGPAAFSDLYAAMADTIAAYRAARAIGDEATRTPLEPRIRLLDAVAKQRDAYASGLYWFTDLDAAVAEARRTDKPILSLRLLGNLDEEYSCANSRFFRTVLYADAQLGAVLRDGFVLHWQSVRPAPVVTIDMGDGRVLRRTITGNSAHYVLDARGRVVDALPGLYGPRAFERLLTDAAHEARRVSDMDDATRRTALMAWHANRAAQPVDEAELTELAARYADDARLDGASVRLMREKGVPAEVAMPLAVSKRVVEDPLLRMVRAFESSIALDTARNEHVLHRRLHEHFAAGEGLDDVNTLNAWVYAELFQTPNDDPWLGLAPADAYAALDRGDPRETPPLAAQDDHILTPPRRPEGHRGPWHTAGN